MLGNLSQTIVQVPTFFHLLAKLSSKEFKKTRYREPPLIDTFSQLKKINYGRNHRYFRINEHFKETAPYKDLNYNNNKRFISPVTKLPKRSLNEFLFSEYEEDIEPRLRRNISQEQILPNCNSINICLNDNNNNINIENNRYKEENNFQSKNEEQKNNKENNNEYINNDEKKDKESQEIEDEHTKIKKYLEKLKKIKPKNLKELRDYLDIKFEDESKKNVNVLPKIRRVNKSISQDDLFKQTINNKIASLTTIKPEIRNSIYKRAKNIMLKRDYDLLHKIYSNHKNYHFKFKNDNDINHLNIKENYE